MTAKLSDIPGTISAFWLLPTDGQDPPELDVAEVVGDDPNTLVSTTHSAVNGTNNSWVETPDMSQGFHTYAVDWEPNTITWYFDGQQVKQEATPSDLNIPMYMALSEESGTPGSWEGAPPSPFKATMDVQSVQAWTSNPYTSPTATQTYSTTSAPVSSDTAASVGASAIVGLESGGMEFVYDTTGADNGAAPNYSFIQDFNPQMDRLDFQNTTQSFGSIYIATASDGHAIVESDHNVVQLFGISPSQLNATNVLFNVSTS
jgi:beta-glucanase (GH16 family)